MLEILFSSHDLLNKLHLIYRDSEKHKKQNYSLLTIDDADGYGIKLPYSSMSLYDLYVIIGRNVKTDFYKLIANDKEMLGKFEYLKEHTSTLSTTMEEIMKSERDTFISKNRFFIFLRNIFLNEQLIDQYHDFKLKSMLDRVIHDEEGIMDTYYIYLFLSDMSNDIGIDMMNILVRSVNSYTCIVSYQTKSNYPIIEDYGTAQLYLNRVASNAYTEASLKSSKQRYHEHTTMTRFPNRLYKKGTDDISLKKYIRKQFKILNGRICLELGILGFLPTIILILVYSFNPLLLWIIPYGLILSYRLIRKQILMKRLDTMMKIENRILKPLCDTERQFINSQYKL